MRNILSMKIHGRRIKIESRYVAHHACTRETLESAGVRCWRVMYSTFVLNGSIFNAVNTASSDSLNMAAKAASEF